MNATRLIPIILAVVQVASCGTPAPGNPTPPAAAAADTTSTRAIPARAIDPDRDLLFMSNEDGVEDIYRLDVETGKRSRVTVTDSVVGEQRGSWVPDWSPDGERVVFASNRDDGGSANIYIVDRDGSNLERLTNREGFDYTPDFSPDGSRIAFMSDRDGAYDLYTMAPDGSDVTRLTELAKPPGTLCCPDWSPDGSRIAFQVMEDNPLTGQRGSTGTIWVVNADGSDAHQLLIGGGLPRWSPDGSRIAYAGLGFQIYTTPPDGSERSQITDMDGNATYPTWSPDGSRLAFTYLPPDSARTSFDSAELYVVALDGSPPERLTRNDFMEAHTNWW